uniref:Uncharacterized protein n=1 Tax=Panagrolaimus sp. JU765 TaxID=591449 RepID=A0AC34QJW2_9BILA
MNWFFVHILLVFLGSYFCLAVRTQHYSNGPVNAYSPMPASGRILEMLREKNTILYRNPLQTTSKSDDSYFGLMRRLAEKEGISYQLTPVATPKNKMSYIQYLPSTTKEGNPDGTQTLCRRLRIC